MKRAALIAVLFACSATAAEYQISVDPPATGYELLKALVREEQSVKNERGVQAMAETVMAKGYIAGLANALAESQICPPGKIFSTNFYLAVRAYLEQNTALLGGPPYPLVKQALLVAFPCK